MSSRHVLASLIVTGALAIASPSLAQPSAGDAALATELFTTGRDLMKDGNFAAACPKLAESARLDAKVGTFARLAECEEKLAHLALARGNWQKAFNLARAENDSRLTHVKEELERLDRIVPKLTITLAGAAPSGLELALDGTKLGEGSLGVALPVDPGRHVVTASAPGRQAWSGPVDLKADGSVTAVKIPALAEQAQASTPGPEPRDEKRKPGGTEPAPSEGTSPLRIVGLATAGVGIVGLGIGGVFALSAKSKLDDSNAPGGCKGNECPSEAAATRNKARDAGDMATIFVVAGGVLVAAGAALYLVAPSKAKDRSVAIAAAPGGLTLHGTW